MMMTQLEHLASNTIFKVAGLEYQIGHNSGSIYYSPETAQWTEWVKGADDRDESKCLGLACRPKLGGQFQSARELVHWFPLTQEVTVSFS